MSHKIIEIIAFFLNNSFYLKYFIFVRFHERIIKNILLFLEQISYCFQTNKTVF